MDSRPKLVIFHVITMSKTLEKYLFLTVKFIEENLGRRLEDVLREGVW